MSDSDKKRKEPYSPADASMDFMKQPKLFGSSSVDTETFSQIMKNDSSFQEAFIPLIKVTIENTFELFKKSAVDPLVETNARLMETIKEQSDMITNQAKTIDVQKKSNSKYIKELQNDINDIQQYSRRTSLRIFNLNIPEEVEGENQLTEHMVSYLNKNVLVKPGSNSPSGSATNSDDRDDSRNDDDQVTGDSVSNYKEHPKSGLPAISVNEVERCHLIGQGKNIF